MYRLPKEAYEMIGSYIPYRPYGEEEDSIVLERVSYAFAINFHDSIVKAKLTECESVPVYRNLWTEYVIADRMLMGFDGGSCFAERADKSRDMHFFETSAVNLKSGGKRTHNAMQNGVIITPRPGLEIERSHA